MTPLDKLMSVNRAAEVERGIWTALREGQLKTPSEEVEALYLLVSSAKLTNKAARTVAEQLVTEAQELLGKC
jgi:hypothetical protein